MASLISVGQVLDQSLAHCRKHFKELLAITLWIVIASIPSVVGKLLAPSGGGEDLNGGDWLTFSLSLVGVIAVMIVSIWSYATLVLTVAEQAEGKRVVLKQLYRKGWQAFVPYLLLTVLLGLIVLGIAAIAVPGYVLLLLSAADNASTLLGSIGTPLFFIGSACALYLLAKYTVQLAFAPYALLIDKRGVVDAIKASNKLVTGRWWATFFRFAIPKIIYFLALLVVSYVVFAALGLLMSVLATSSSFLVLVVYTLSLFLSVFLSAIVTPLIIATDYYLYNSLKNTR